MDLLLVDMAKYPLVMSIMVLFAFVSGHIVNAGNGMDEIDRAPEILFNLIRSWITKIIDVAAKITEIRRINFQKYLQNSGRISVRSQNNSYNKTSVLTNFVRNYIHEET